MQKIKVALLISGASGMPIFLQLLENLLSADCLVHLVFSNDALLSFAQELKYKLSSDPDKCKNILLLHNQFEHPENLTVYSNLDWYSPLASGSGACDYTIVCPCSMSSLAKIAYGISESLLLRTVDVAIKERKKVILVPRETPLSSIHLENMLKLSNLGVAIVPPIPAFYTHPENISDIITFIVVKILDQMDINRSRLIPSWGS